MSRSVGRICAGFYLAVSLAVTYIAFGSPVALENPGLGDLPYFALIGLHYLWGAVLVLSSTEYRRFIRGAYRRFLFVPELLAAGSLLFFLFSYIFATNANMDYVQRFIASGGNLRLALDTETERLLVWVRVFPLVAVNLGTYLFLRFGRYRMILAATHRRGFSPDRVVRPWAFLLTLLSAFLVTVAMPSFLSLDGYAALGWIGFVPIFLVLRTSRPGHALFYGVTFGTFQTLLSSYWLGTFSLVSLQITVLFFLIYYLIFTPVITHVRRVSRWAGVLVFPLGFTLLEYLRSSGFLGYPWALAAHSQYAVLPVIQLAAITGVWGVSFIVLLANSGIAEFLGAFFSRISARRGPPGRPVRGGISMRRSFGWLTGIAAVTGAIVLGSGIILATENGDEDDVRTVRVAQIQQNNDPRKHEYEDTLNTLKRLTNETLPSQPQLIIWSETAFVPNIRRWSVDTSNRRYHLLVQDMLAYQKSLQRWLLTGNDDYEIVVDENGEVVDRYEFNAAVLFSDTGERRETYRKIQLVPFTEYFPYREQLPWLYDLLLNFDVHFWEPGTVQTVFEHPDVRFSTPICYEDVFPNYVRGFVTNGAEAIFNISNDYWSLTPIQAKQHFVAGLFRAVENRRPVLRTTASGLTGQIDSRGRIIQTAPYYEEASLVSDVRIPREQPTTIYTRFGDYFPLASGGLLVVIWLSSLIAGLVERRRPGPLETAGPLGPAGPDKATRGDSGAGPAGRSGADPARQRSTGAAGEQRAQAEQKTAKRGQTAKSGPRTATGTLRASRNAGRPQRNPLSVLGKPLGGRRKKRAKKPKTNWRNIWDQ